MTHPTHEPKRKLHYPWTPPLMVTRLSNQYAPTVANDPSSSPGCSTAIDYNQPQTPETHQSPALPPRVSNTIANTQSPVPEHRVFSIYSPTVTFKSDSEATDILMRHILQNYTTYTDDDLRITTPTPYGPKTILYGVTETGDNVWRFSLPKSRPAAAHNFIRHEQHAE
jgi:hypothetical protein